MLNANSAASFLVKDAYVNVGHVKSIQSYVDGVRPGEKMFKKYLIRNVKLCQSC